MALNTFEQYENVNPSGTDEKTLEAQKIIDTYKARGDSAVSSDSNTPILTQVVQDPIGKLSEAFTTAGDTIIDTLGNAGLGAWKAIEGVVDFVGGTVGTVAGEIFGNKDLQNNIATFQKVDWTNELVGNGFNQNMQNSTSLLNANNAVTDIVKEVAQSQGGMLFDLTATALTGGASAVGTAAGETAALTSMFLRASGNANEEALNDGGTPTASYFYGLASGGVEVATEKMSDGLGGLYGNGFLDKTLGGQIGATGLKRIALNALEEANEEVVGELVSPLTKAIYKGTEAFDEYKDSDYWAGVAKAGLVGGLSALGWNATVGKAIGGKTGKSADIASSLEAINNNIERRTNDYENGKLTEGTNQLYGSYLKANLDNITKTLQSVDEAERSKLITEYGLENTFNADGTYNETLLQSYGYNGDGTVISADNSYNKNAYSPNLWGNEFEVNAALENATANNSAITLSVADNLTEAETTAFRKLTKAVNAMGLNVGVVAVDSNNDAYNAHYDLDSNTMVINRDRLADGTWAKEFVHETWHGLEDTSDAKSLMNQLRSKGYITDDMVDTDDIISSYNLDADVIAKGIAGEKLTADEQQQYDTYVSETNAKAVETIFGNQDFVDRVIRNNKLTGRILNRMSDIADILKKADSKEARAEIKRINKAERMYINALENIGKAYRNGKVVNTRAQDDDTEEATTDRNHNTENNANSNNKENNVKLSMSKEQIASDRANYLRDKRYLLKDSEHVVQNILDDLTATTDYEIHLTGKTTDEITHELWYQFNTRNEDYRYSGAAKIADMILDNMAVRSILESDDEGELDTAKNKLAMLESYKRSFNLDSIKSDLKSVYDSKTEMARITSIWGGGNASIDQVKDEIVSSNLASQEFIDATNPADMLVALDNEYKATLQKIKDETVQYYKHTFTADEYREMKQNIMKDVVNAYETEGEESAIAKQINKWKKQVNAYREIAKNNYEKNRAENRVLKQLEWFNNEKNGLYVSGSEVQAPQIIDAAKILSSINRGGNISSKIARSAMVKIREWYNDKNENIADMFDQETADLIDSIGLNDSASDPNLSLSELRSLRQVLIKMKKTIEDFKSVQWEGKRQDRVELATKAVEMLKGNKILMNTSGIKEILNKYAETFLDPESLFSMADAYKNGINTQTFNQLRNATENARMTEIELTRELDDFCNKHQQWVRSQSERTVQYHGHAISIQKAYYLHDMFKRTDAQAGLVKNGEEYTDKHGNVIQIEALYHNYEDIPHYNLDEYLEQKRIDMGVPMLKMSDIKLFTDEYNKSVLEDIAKQEVKALEDQFTELDMEYINIIRKGYDKAAEIKYERDISKNGYSNVKGTFYIPVKRAGIAAQVGVQAYKDEVESVNNSSFNKNTVKNERKLVLNDYDAVYRQHVKGIAQYRYIGEIVDSINLLYNTVTNGNANNPTTINTELRSVWKNGKAYLDELIINCEGRTIGKSQIFSGSIWGAFRGAYGRFAVNGNAKVILTQFSSIFASTSIVDFKDIAYGFQHLHDADTLMDKYCQTAYIRNYDDAAINAEMVTTKREASAAKAKNALNKMNDALAKPIAFTDRLVVKVAWGAAQSRAASEGYAYGTEANYKRAGEILKQIIYKTQQNSQMTERSAAMRSSDNLLKSVTMFTADSMKIQSRIVDAAFEFNILKKQYNSASADQKEALLSSLKSAKKKLGKAIAANVMASVYMAALALLFKAFYGRLKDEEPEEAMKGFIEDVIGNTFGGMPVFSDIYDYFTNGYDLSTTEVDSLNEMLSVSKDVVESIVTWNTDSFPKLLKEMLFTGGMLAGIPTRNLYNLSYGILNLISPTTAYELDSVMYTQSYSADLTKAIENGDSDMVATITGLIADKKLGFAPSKAVRNEFTRLALTGNTVSFKSYSTITVDGESVSLSSSEQKTFKNLYSVAGDVSDKLVASAAYQKLTDEQKAKALKFVYDTYYQLAKDDYTGTDSSTKNVLFGEAVPINILASVYAYAGTCYSDNTTSKKMKITSYLQSLNITAAQKYIIMGYLGYTNTVGNAQVRNYINSLNLTSAEKKELYSMSGYAA